MRNIYQEHQERLAPVRAALVAFGANREHPMPLADLIAELGPQVEADLIALEATGAIRGGAWRGGFWHNRAGGNGRA